MSHADPPALSFNEVVALATKAARGAELGWGHAEDLGRAARWLADHGLPWDEALCSLLETDDVAVRTSRMAELADWAAHAVPGESRTLDGAQDAIWILPLISAAMFGRSGSLVIRWSGATIHLASDGGLASDRPLPQIPGQQGAMTLEVVPEQSTLAGQPERLARPGPMSPVALARLSALADLTLVPASEASRAKGAGSTRPDND